MKHTGLWFSALLFGAIGAVIWKFDFIPTTWHSSSPAPPQQISAQTTIVPVPYTAGSVSAETVDGTVVPMPDEASPTHVVETGDDGKTTGEGYRLNGIRVGVWTFYHPDGTIRCHGEYEQGKCVGTWTFHHPNGTVWSRGEFVDGYRAGLWNFFHENGNLMSSGEFDEQGQKQGTWVTYDTNGVKQLEGSFADGKPTGLWRGYPTDDSASYWEGEFDAQGRKTGQWVWYKAGKAAVADEYHEGERLNRVYADVEPTNK